MKPSTTTDIDAVFRALAHPTRRSLVEALARGPETVVKLAEPYEMSLNAVSKHVKTLEAAGLVERSRDRTFHQIALKPDSLRPALQWIEHYAHFWRENLVALKQDLEGK